MILRSDYRIMIGARGVGVYDCYGVFAPEQTFVVVREATREEWLAAGNSESANESKRAHFYEIATD